METGKAGKGGMEHWPTHATGEDGDEKKGMSIYTNKMYNFLLPII